MADIGREKSLQAKLATFQKARLNILDLPLDHLKFKNRQTRLGGDGPTYSRPFSHVNGHIFSFYPQTTQLWNRLPPEVKSSDDIDFFNKGIKSLNLTSIQQKMSVF